MYSNKDLCSSINVIFVTPKKLHFRDGKLLLKKQELIKRNYGCSFARVDSDRAHRRHQKHSHYIVSDSKRISRWTYNNNVVRLRLRRTIKSKRVERLSIFRIA